MNHEQQIWIELVEERAALRDIVTGIRHHLLLPRPVATANQRLTKIVVAVLFALYRMAFAAHGVGESDAVRRPFGQQKNQKCRRDDASKANF